MDRINNIHFWHSCYENYDKYKDVIPYITLRGGHKLAFTKENIIKMIDYLLTKKD